jgi:hypothetical protein
MTRSVVFLLAAVFPLIASAQTTPPPSDSALAGIVARGRMLAAYDRAAWHGTDAIMEKLPNPAGVEGFIAQVDANGSWHLLFGRTTVAGDTLFVVARADQSTTPDSFHVSVPMPQAVGTDVERRAFRAMKTAGAELKSSPRAFNGTYNTYVLSRPDGSWYVYFLPAQTQQGVYPHAGDYRYVVSSGGDVVQSKFQMHRTVLNQAVPADAVAGVHTVVVEDLPQDSDVFLVLSRKPPKPELVATAHFTYQIQVDGSITWIRAKAAPADSAH